jgi:hypothetical protein
LRQLGQPKVEDLELAIPGHEKILGLEIAMDDAVIVGGGKPMSDRDRDLHRFADGQGPRGQALAQCVPFEDLRDEERLTIGLADIVNMKDIGVVEPSDGSRLELEPALAAWVGGERRGKDLESHIPPQPGIAGAVDLSHTAGAKLVEHFVGAEV